LDTETLIKTPRDFTIVKLYRSFTDTQLLSPSLTKDINDAWEVAGNQELEVMKFEPHSSMS